MSRLTLIALTGVFVLSGLAVALVGGAEARSTGEGTLMVDQPQLEQSVERCSLQPYRVTHPDNGTRILVLRKTC
ncbi:MAG: hypothetical protein RIC24_04305 [Hyphomicrobiales bacterium]|jgi:hypothetical protein